jgi:hypothetical protein
MKGGHANKDEGKPTGRKPEHGGEPKDQILTEKEIRKAVGEPTARATIEVIKLLEVQKFFSRSNMKAILDKLEDCDQIANSADFNGDMMFIALSLPIANGVIHIASNRRALCHATKWLMDNWESDDNKGPDKEDPDKISILSALMLIYIVMQGWKKYKGNKEKQKIWGRIRTRVEKLSTESLDENNS